MRREARRIALLLITGFVGYKLTIALFANKIPGQPFYGFGLHDWLMWFMSPSELAFVVIALLLEYWLLYIVTKRLSTSSLVAWSGILGGYFAGMLFPFNLMHGIDDLPDSYWPPGLIGAALELVLFFGIVPLLLGMALLALRRSARSEP